MNLIPVKDSSVIAGYAYDPETRVLRVQTKSGATYDHPGVPMEKAEAFAGAASKGAFWNKKIQPHHKATKVETKK